MEIEADGDDAGAYAEPGGGYDEQNFQDDDASSMTASQCVGGSGGRGGQNGGRGGGVGGRALSQETPSSNATGRGRGSAKGKETTKKKCRLCAKWFGEDDFSPNSPYCRDDKQAVDNLAKQANQQGQAEFFKEARQNEEKLKKMVARYREMCPYDKMKGKRGHFSIVSYKEEFSAESAVVVAARGRMMTEGMFVKWAQTAEGGSMSEDEAKAKWVEYRGDPHVLRDEKGPPKAPLRIRINLYDDVDFTTATIHAKRQLCQANKEGKNVDKEDAQRQRRMILKGHDRGGLGRNGEEADFGGIAAGMLANTAAGAGSSSSPGNAFAGAGALLQDIRSLVPDAEEDDEEAPPEGSEADGGRGLSAAEEPRKRGTESADAHGDDSSTPSKRPKWFDMESAVSKARRMAELANLKVREALTDAEKFLGDNLREIGLQPPEVQSLYAKEVGVAQNRLAFTVAALASGQPAGAQAEPGAEADKPEDLSTLLGHVTSSRLRPPCAEWAELTTADKLEEATETVFKGIESAETRQQEALTSRSFVLQLLTAPVAAAFGCRQAR